MKKIFSVFIAILSFLFSNPGFAAQQKILLESDSSWDGNQVSDTISTYIKIKPGERMPFHCHPFSSFVYVISGTLTVEKMDGSKRNFKKGDSFIEVVDTWHRGINKSKNKPVEIVAFYLKAEPGDEITIPFNEENKGMCTQ